jgi:hypothetical protein
MFGMKKRRAAAKSPNVEAQKPARVRAKSRSKPAVEKSAAEKTLARSNSGRERRKHTPAV